MARVLKLCELTENKVIWYEDRNGKTWVAEIIAIKYDDITFSGCNNEVHVNPKNYGIHYRCWTEKPEKRLIGIYW